MLNSLSNLSFPKSACIAPSKYHSISKAPQAQFSIDSLMSMIQNIRQSILSHQVSASEMCLNMTRVVHVIQEAKSMGHLSVSDLSILNRLVQKMINDFSKRFRSTPQLNSQSLRFDIQETEDPDRGSELYKRQVSGLPYKIFFKSFLPLIIKSQCFGPHHHKRVASVCA
tara:strand:- start:6815 stop:7321 length:507 start_codon:yes stop_codon:yes gene_type:complete